MRERSDHKLVYIRELFAQEFDCHIKKQLFFGKKQGIQISPEESKLLALFIKICNIKTIVEVGTLYGYSSICMAMSIPDCGHIYTIENNPEHSKIAKKNFASSALNNKITILEGNGLDMLNDLSIRSPFDMIFIDADKGNYTQYLDWAEIHIRQHGLVIADNTLLFDTVFLNIHQIQNVSKRSWQSMRDFNKRLSNSKKYCSILIPTTEGMSVALKLT